MFKSTKLSIRTSAKNPPRIARRVRLPGEYENNTNERNEGVSAKIVNYSFE